MSTCTSLCALAFTVRPPSGHDQKTRFYASESSLPSLVHMLTMPNRWSGPKRPMALTCFGLVSPPRCESTAVHCWPEHMRARLKIMISRLESPHASRTPPDVIQPSEQSRGSVSALHWLPRRHGPATPSRNRPRGGKGVKKITN